MLTVCLKKATTPTFSKVRVPLRAIDLGCERKLNIFQTPKLEPIKYRKIAASAANLWKRRPNCGLFTEGVTVKK